MFKYFQVSIQKVKKNLNLNLNMAIMHNHPEFKFNFQTKPQMKFCLKQKLKISKFWTTFVFKSFSFEAKNKEKNWIYKLEFETSSYLKNRPHSTSSPVCCSARRAGAVVASRRPWPRVSHRDERRVSKLRRSPRRLYPFPFVPLFPRARDELSRAVQP